MIRLHEIMTGRVVVSYYMVRYGTIPYEWRMAVELGPMDKHR